MSGNDADVKEYDALLVQQTNGGKALVFFAAPAIEVEEWAGVPQRRKLTNGEMVGFQREEKQSRVNDLVKFFKDPNNVVQNPLLGAPQDRQRVEFKPSSPGSPFGRLCIAQEDYSKLSMAAILKRLISILESRVDGLRDAPLDEQRVAQLARLESAQGTPEDPQDESDEYEREVDDVLESDDSSIDEAEATASVMLSEETHLVDFYAELRARLRVLEQRGVDDAEEIQGFTKDSLCSYLKPVALVDGQHRLRGAAKSAVAYAQSPSGQAEILQAVRSGIDPDQAERQVILGNSRHLPISLLMDDSPSEHVFQFIIVNQRATPMGQALLGTIVSTSLSRNEMDAVADRLRAAGIKLEDSQAVAYLTRSADSPFRGVVQTGLQGDHPDLLQWTVLRSLVSIFRELRGGRPYNQKVDYAKAWRAEFLPQSGLVDPGTDEEKFADWSRPDGPWRAVFIGFFCRIRDYFGDEAHPDTFNGWGSTAKSNLFNKISLTILAADFFEFLYTQEEPLSDLSAFETALESWLRSGRVSESYFNRDWKLDNIKKDQAPVKRLWAQNWQEYRKVPTAGFPRKYKP
ncbi:hypothetical protein ACFY4B_40360 [Kitasatospora sp. NPDC001261]|uniref:hypothetical protein n=1 Tax=Kitasatospora sp. NPDC001261 TaxID=3364012 RepID=UPI0036B574D2